MKAYEIVSMARSSHHAVAGWLMRNLYNTEVWKSGSKFNKLPNNQIVYVNEGNFSIEVTLDFLSRLDFSNTQALFVSYENCDGDFSILSKDLTFCNIVNNEYDLPIIECNRMLVIRDFYNLCASRLQKSGLNTDVNEMFIEQWKSQARLAAEDKVHHVIYEKWLVDPFYRKDFLISFANVKERFSPDTIMSGADSSFLTTNTQDRITRYNQIEFPKEFIDLVNGDLELQYLIGKLNLTYLPIEDGNLITK